MQSLRIGILSLRRCLGSALPGVLQRYALANARSAPDQGLGRRGTATAEAGPALPDGVWEDCEGRRERRGAEKGGLGKARGQMSQRCLMCLEPGHDIRHLRKIQQRLT